MLVTMLRTCETEMGVVWSPPHRGLLAGKRAYALSWVRRRVCIRCCGCTNEEAPHSNTGSLGKFHRRWDIWPKSTKQTQRGCSTQRELHVQELRGRKEPAVFCELQVFSLIWKGERESLCVWGLGKVGTWWNLGWKLGRGASHDSSCKTCSGHLILKVMERAFRGFQARTDGTRFRKGPLAATRRVS